MGDDNEQRNQGSSLEWSMYFTPLIITDDYGQHWPTLTAELTPQLVYVQGPHKSETDLHVTGLLGKGLQLITPSTPTPPPVKGWQATIARVPAGQPVPLTILAPPPEDPLPLCDNLDLPAEWLDLAIETQAVFVLGGTIGMQHAPNATQALDHAAQNGLLAGGLIPLTWTKPTTD